MENLSPAVQMMVAITRAMQDVDGASGGVLVLDEPTASLPKNEVEFLLTSIRQLAASGLSILLVTHRLVEVEQVCDEATVLRDGQVVARLGRDDLSQDKLVQAITGASASAHEARSVNNRSGTVLSYVPDDGSLPLVLRAGECVGVAGLLSSGRSNLLKRIFGALPRGGDKLTVRGVDVPPGHPWQAMQAGIALVPEDRSAEAIFGDLDLIQNLSVAHLSAHQRGLFFVSGASERHAASELLSSFGVKAPSAEVPISALSGGNQQKVMIARWMQRLPAVLLLDEPTQGIDVGARAEIHRLIDHATREGLAVLFVSCDFEELAHVSDRVVVIHEGRVVDEVPSGPIDEEDLYQKVFAKENIHG